MHFGIIGVYFLRYRNDVSQILNKTNIINLVSKHEELPRSIMEAIVFGEIAVVSNIGRNHI